MTRLDIIYADFWVGIAAQVYVLGVYAVQARQLAEKWNWSRLFLTMMAVIVSAWFIIGLTSQRGPSTDDTHLIFFTSVTVLFVFEAVMVTVLARRELLRRRAEQSEKDQVRKGTS